MKKIVVALLVAFSVFASKAHAQTQPAQTPTPTQENRSFKVGYTNVSYLLSIMPEAKQFEEYNAVLKKQLDGKVKTLEQKYAAYQQGAATMTEAVRAQREQEIRNMDADLQQFQQKADSSLKAKQLKLIEPATERISKAIDEVAKENGFTYIFNSDAGMGTTQIILHAPESDNVTDLIVKKLGIDPKAASNNAATVAPATNQQSAPAKTAPAPSKKKKK